MVVPFGQGYAGVFGGREGLNFELDGTRLCELDGGLFCFEVWALTGEVGRAVALVVIALVSGGLCF